jgi:hypothetical protein
MRKQSDFSPDSETSTIPYADTSEYQNVSVSKMFLFVKKSSFTFVFAPKKQI